jgi:hypothetical protein
MMAEGEGLTTSKATVPADSRATCNLRDMAGPGKNVSVKVEASIPVVAERPMYFDYQGPHKRGWQEDLPGTGKPEEDSLR